MIARRVALALAFVAAALVIQTTIFSRVKPFNVTPMLVVLVVMAVVRYLDAEPGVLVGFTAGILLDLLSESPLGMWAMVVSTVAFLTLRVRERAEDGPLVVAAGVFGITLAGAVLFAILGTLFGMETLSDLGVVRRVVLPAVYNVVLAGAVLPLVTVALREGSRRRLRL